MTPRQTRSRLAVYWLPEDGPLAAFGAAWLGWDAAAGCEVAHPDVEGLPAPLEEITRRPRPYGLHATLKPPFALAQGRDEADLDRALAALAARTPPASAPGLRLAAMGRFLALVPDGPAPALDALAASLVADLDPFRAPPSEAELARRRAAGLTPGQDALLLRWGYPHVMGAFRFHVTLTGPLAPGPLAAVEAAARPLVTPLLPEPLVIRSVALLREDAEGRFGLVRRHPLGALPDT